MTFVARNRLLLVIVLTLFMSALSFASPTQEDTPCSFIIAKAWTDPNYGDDSTAQINDPGMPFETLNGAINAVHAYLISLYMLPNPVIGEGIVYALPGVRAGATGTPDS